MMRKIQLLTVVFLIYGMSANTQDRIFCHTYPSNVLPAMWLTPNCGLPYAQKNKITTMPTITVLSLKPGWEKIFKHSFTLITRKKIPEKN